MSTQQLTQKKTVWNIDAAHSEIGFSVKHMMITRVRGRFADVAGTLTVDEAEPSNSEVRVEIDAASIDTGQEDRDEHLRSEDFLDVESHPELRFESTRIEGAGLEPGTSFTVVGNLTIAGVTKEVELDATYEGGGTDPWGGDRAAFSADTAIDRRDFGLEWNQALETGGILVGNEVRIHLDVQAVREEDEEA
jgi:polyisoprenoid-binding protein YceI